MSNKIGDKIKGKDKIMSMGWSWAVYGVSGDRHLRLSYRRGQMPRT